MIISDVSCLQSVSIRGYFVSMVFLTKNTYGPSFTTRVSLRKTDALKFSRYLSRGGGSCPSVTKYMKSGINTLFKFACVKRTMGLPYTCLTIERIKFGKGVVQLYFPKKDIPDMVEKIASIL